MKDKQQLANRMADRYLEIVMWARKSRPRKYQRIEQLAFERYITPYTF